MRRKIGTLVLTEATVFTRTYETASWYTRIEVPAGGYDITAVVRDGKVSDAWSEAPIWKLPGVVVASHFVNRVFTASSSETDRDVGKPDTYVSGTNTHSLAGVVAEKDGSLGGGRVVLDDDIEVRETSRYAGYKGEERILYGLFVKEAVTDFRAAGRTAYEAPHARRIVPREILIGDDPGIGGHGIEAAEAWYAGWDAAATDAADATFDADTA